MEAVGSGFIRYHVTRRVGVGAAADVFKASDPISGINVALKTARIDRSDKNGRDSLRREYEILRSINEPALPWVNGYRRTLDGRPLIVMEWIEGSSLSLAQKALPWNRETLGALFALFSAVQSLHRRGWAHLDIKPANVILQGRKLTANEESRVRLLDAGLMARVGDIIKPRGTPGYIAPELLDSEASWDFRSDLFSLGSVCYKLLAGREAFAGVTAIEVLRKSVQGDCVPLDDVRPDLPPPLVEFVSTLLATKPQNRPEGAREALRVLERVSELEGWEPQVLSETPWRMINCLPWPPISRPENRAILDFVTGESPSRFRLVEVQAPAGLGRESFGRDLADQIAFAGQQVEAVVGADGLVASPVDADSLWAAALTSDKEAPRTRSDTGERTMSRLADHLRKCPMVLVWDMGSAAPVWLGQWIDQLNLSLASVSARARSGGNSVTSLVVLYGSKPSHTIERRINLPSLEIKLGPQPEEALEPYVLEQLTSGSSSFASSSGEERGATLEDVASRVVQTSLGYPEVLGALLDRWVNERSVPAQKAPAQVGEDPHQVLATLLSARSKTLGAHSSEVLRVLECTTTALGRQTLSRATGLEGEQLTRTLEGLQTQRLVFCAPTGWEVSYRDLLEAGYRLMDPPSRSLHQQIADALSCRAREGTAETWLARSHHLLESEGHQVDRVVLVAALRLFRGGRFEEAKRFLENWHERRNRSCGNARGLWCLRLLLQLVWESRDYERFTELRAVFPDRDPVAASLESRTVTAQGDPQRALKIVEDLESDKLSTPLEVFLLMARAFALEGLEGPARFCREAQALASKFPRRGCANLKSLVLQRLAQQALRCGDEKAAEEAVELMDEFSQRERDPLLEIGALVSRAYLAFHRSDLQTARSSAQDALDVARAAGHINQVYGVLSLLGGIAFEAGRWEEAVRTNRETLAIDEATSSHTRKSNTMRNLCLIRRTQALYEPAMSFGEDALDLARGYGSDMDVISVSSELALCCAEVDRREDAWSAMEGSREILKAIAPGLHKATALEAMAHSAPIPASLAPREIEPTLALEAYNTDLEAGLKDNAAELALEVAWDALRADSVDEAREWLERSESFPKGKVPRIDIWRALVNGRLVAAEEAWGRPEGKTAWNEIEEAIKLARKWGFYELLWRLEYIKANGLMMQGRRKEAIEQLRQAKSTMDRIVNAMKEERHRRGYLSRPDQSRLLRLLEALDSQ